MSRVRVNYKSDLPPIEVEFKLAGVAIPVPTHDFVVRFFVDGAPGTSFDCAYKNGRYINCEKTDEDTLTCYINNHKFSTGGLCCEFVDLSPNGKYADGVQKTVTPTKLNIALIDGAGDDSAEITSSVAIDIETIIGELRDISSHLEVHDGVIDALEEDVFGSEELAWSASYYYTGDYEDDGTVDSTPRQSTVFESLFVDLTKDFDLISFTCQGSQDNNVALPYFILNEDGDVLDISTLHSVVEVTLTPNNLPEGAVGLYLNNYSQSFSGNKCVISKGRIGSVVERIDAIEEDLLVEEEPQWKDVYYPTSDYPTDGTVDKTPHQSTVFKGLYIDLTQDFARITFRCQGSQGNAVAYPYFILDDEDNVLRISTESTVQNVVLTPDTLPEGAVGLYLNNYPTVYSGYKCVVETWRLDPLEDKVENLEESMFVTENVPFTTGYYYQTNGYYEVPKTKVPSASQSTVFEGLYIDLTKSWESIKIRCHGSFNNLAHPYFFADANDDWLTMCEDETVVETTFTHDNIPEGAVALYLNNYPATYDENICLITRSRISESNQPLKGKKVVMFGDSITEFADGKGKSYSDYFAEMTGATVYNVGIGGSHLTDGSTPSTSNMCGLYVNQMVQAWISQDFTNPDKGVEYRRGQGDTHDAEQVARLKSILPEDTDIVTIMAGTNDTASAVIGEPTDTNPQGNIFATVKAIVSAIHTEYPHMKIYFFTPNVHWVKIGGQFTDEGWCDNYVPSSGLRMIEVCQGITRACKYLHIPCCDMYYGMGWNKYNWLDIAEDGVHPLNGFEAIGAKFAAFVTDCGEGAGEVDKQETLVSGTNIKTINNQSLLGSGNITIQGGGGGSAVQSDWNQSDSSADDYIKNKPTLATVATSGSYDDLSDKPTIPAAQVQSDWNESDNTSKAYIQNKPTIPAAQVQSDWNEASSSSKAYIQNKPTIPTVPTNVSAFNNDAGYLTQHQSIKTVNGISMVGTGNVSTETPVVEVSGAAPTQTLSPNTFYKFTGAVTSLTLTLGSEVSGIANIFAFSFTAGADNPTISISPSVTIADTPDIHSGDYVEFNIMDGKAIAKVWSA